MPWSGAFEQKLSAQFKCPAYARPPPPPPSSLTFIGALLFLLFDGLCWGDPEFNFSVLCNVNWSASHQLLILMKAFAMLKKKKTWELFSLECWKVIGFATLRYAIGSEKLASLFHPIRGETTITLDALTQVFPRFMSATSICFVFWLVHCIVCVLCDWLEWSLWFWFYDTQLKTMHCNEVFYLFWLFFFNILYLGLV